MYQFHSKGVRSHPRGRELLQPEPTKQHFVRVRDIFWGEKFWLFFFQDGEPENRFGFDPIGQAGPDASLTGAIPFKKFFRLQRRHSQTTRMSKPETCHATWQDALKACWMVLGKEELNAHELNNWFYDRKIQVKGISL